MVNFLKFSPSAAIFVPTEDFQAVGAQGAEGPDVGRGQPGVGNQGNVEVHGRPAHLVSGPEFRVREVLGNVHHKVHLVLADQVHDDLGVGHDGEGFQPRILGEEDLVAAVSEQLGGAVLDLVAEQHGLEFDRQPIREFAALADQFETYRGDLAAFLLDEYPDVTDFFRHGLPQSVIGDEFMDEPADTGGIRVKNTEPKKAEFASGTGDMRIEGLKTEGSVSILTDTGDLKLRNVSCGDLTAESNTGDLRMENVLTAAAFNIKSDTGSVTFNDSDAAEITIITNTGDVNGTLLSEKVFLIETDTGDVNVPKSITGGRCEITTDTGDIDISIK